MTSTTHRAFLGDAERDFTLTPPMVAELERLAGVGIGALFERVIRREFRHADLIETIRLALIGGGTDPQDALNVVSTYVIGRPYSEVFPLALAILEARWFGTAAPADAEDAQ